MDILKLFSKNASDNSIDSIDLAHVAALRGDLRQVDRN